MTIHNSKGLEFRIEGNPFIIRFKTILNSLSQKQTLKGIEGNPFIIRFKTIYLK